MSPRVNRRLAPSFLAEFFLVIRILLLLHASSNAVRQNSEGTRLWLTSLFFPSQTRISSVSTESRLKHLISSTAAALSRAYEGPRFQTQASSDCLRALRGPRLHRSGLIARNRVK